MSAHSTTQPPARSTADLKPLAPAVSRRAALRGIGGGLTAAAVLTAVPRFAKAGPEHAATQPYASTPPTTVVGVWDLAFQRFDSGAAAGSGSDRALATFAAEGGFQAAMAPAWHSWDGAARYHGGGHGSWTTDDDDQIIARYTALIYDETGACAGARQIIATPRLDAAGSTLNGVYESRHHGVDSEIVGFASGTVAGTSTQFPDTLSPDPVAPAVPDTNDLPPLPGRPGEPY